MIVIAVVKMGFLLLLLPPPLAPCLPWTIAWVSLSRIFFFDHFLCFGACLVSVVDLSRSISRQIWLKRMDENCSGTSLPLWGEWVECDVPLSGACGVRALDDGEGIP